ncbi:MAG: EthD domain-containing protein [Xanthobacteraceae bacterium]
MADRALCKTLRPIPHPTDRPEGSILGDVDGIVQLWFDDMDGFRAFYNSRSYKNVIKPDEERFAAVLV